MGLFGKPPAGADKFAEGVPKGMEATGTPPTAEPEILAFPGMPGAAPMPTAVKEEPAEPSGFPGVFGAPEPEPAPAPEPMPIPEPAATEEAPQGQAPEAAAPSEPPMPFPGFGNAEPQVEHEQSEDGSLLYHDQPLGPYNKEGEKAEAAVPEFHGGAGPCFTKVQPEEENYAGKFSLEMPHVDYIGNTTVLLKTLRDLEQKYKISMPIRSCGIDPVVFAEASKESEDNQRNCFVIMDGEKPVNYELVTVDGAMYASCMSAPLDTEFLHSVIREATMSMTEQGYYIFFMVGLCVLAGEGDEPDSLMRTLRLNSYELSVLCEYMESFGTDIEYGTYGGRQCIYFKAKS